ncbi:hypothetical protein F4801DRAFT_578494 [Xylaria longipes]|nr:hypothetical protein F4801DRAFT_578494 [Xylaria longipes]
MTILPDPYKVLGVSRDAQIPEIRSAHRKLVLKCHPDKIQDPELKVAKQIEFQQVQQAYELLSNEVEREKYDRKFEVYEHLRERERTKTSAAKAPSSTAKQDPTYYNVKDASPRSTTFATKSSPYGRTPPRSYEDTSSSARMFEEAARHARKTASYEKEKPSKRDEERRRRKEEEEWIREKDKERAREARKARERKEEKDRIAREREEREKEREKEKRKEEKKKAQSDREKERGKERKSAAAEKHRARQPQIIEETSDSSDSSDDDVIYEPPPSKSERKKSSSGRKTEDIDPSSLDRTRKYSGNMESAIRYLTRSGAKAPVAFTRSQTYSEGSTKHYSTPAVPTPPPASNAPFAPPPPQVAEPEEITDDDDIARRSAARPSRRMSHDTPRSSREKPSTHKKSSSSRDHQPIIVEAGSPIRTAPSLPRAHTESYATRPIPVPAGLHRADTWYAATDRERDRHERSRSRPKAANFTEDEESEDERERRHRRSRHTQSPEPISRRYAVDGTKSIPIRQKQYHDQPPRGAYKTNKAYVMPNSSARVQRSHKAYTRDYYEEERPQHFPGGIKYSPQIDERDICYSDLPYRGYRSDVVAG